LNSYSFQNYQQKIMLFITIFQILLVDYHLKQLVYHKNHLEILWNSYYLLSTKFFSFFLIAIFNIITN